MDHVIVSLQEWKETFKENGDVIGVECIQKAIEELYKYGAKIDHLNQRKN